MSIPSLPKLALALADWIAARSVHWSPGVAASESQVAARLTLSPSPVVLTSNRNASCVGDAVAA